MGENGNQMILESIFGRNQVIRTFFPQSPRFLEEDIGLIFMGAMTEKNQSHILKNLLPHRDVIKRKINEGQFILFTGNSLDLLGREIIHEDGARYKALDLFNFETRVNKYDRINKFIHGYTKEGSEIHGWISQFTNYSGQVDYLVQSTDKNYGIKYNNLYASSLLGPLLITSPYFTKELLGKMKITDSLPFEKDLFLTFENRKRQMLKNIS